jgi:TetR/AcrR family transcriptional regulator
MLTARGRAGHPRMSAPDRHAQLIEVALDVFSRKGFRGATTKAIAAEAGVTEAVVFRHFRSKEALYTAVLDSRLGSAERQRRRAELEALMARGDDEAVFGAMVRNICGRYARDPRFERVLLFAALEGHRAALARLIERGGPRLRAIAAYIARRQKAGALTAGPPASLLLAVNGMAHFYGIVTRIFQAPIAGGSDEEVIDVFTRVALHGVSRGDSTRTAKKAKK